MPAIGDTPADAVPSTLSEPHYNKQPAE